MSTGALSDTTLAKTFTHSFVAYRPRVISTRTSTEYDDTQKYN